MSFLFGKTKELIENDIKREQMNEIVKKKYEELYEIVKKKYEELQKVQPNETEKQKRERKEKFERFKMFNMKIRKNYDEYIKDFRKWEEEEREREIEIETSNLLLEQKIKEILKNLNFYNKLNKKEYSREELFLGVIDLEKLNYDDFLAYKLYINLNTTYYELGSNIINENENYTVEYFKRLSILSPMIFIKNVNRKFVFVFFESFR